MEISPNKRVLKTLRGSLKRTIFASGGLGLGLLQIVLEPDGVPARTLSPEGVDTGRWANEDIGPQWGVNCEIPHRPARTLGPKGG